MKIQILRVTLFFLMLLCSAPALSKALGDWAGAQKRQPQAGGPGEDPWPPGDGWVNLPRQSHPPASVWEVTGEASLRSRSHSRAMAKPPVGSSKQDSPRELQRLLVQPPRSRSPRLSHHLKGHGKFNGDTHSCHSIQSQSCQKPSDCGGCLGLYTCKLPTGTCGLKAVSRQRGGFLQSIQNPEGREVLLIP